MDEIIKIGSWILSIISGLVASAKGFVEMKKIMDEKVMPDIKTEDKADEIQKKQELAKWLVIFTGIEATYNIARGLILALNFAVLMHYALKFVSGWQHKDSDK